MIKRTGSPKGAIDRTESSLGTIDTATAKRQRSEICAERRIVGIIFHCKVDNRCVYDIFAVDIDSCKADVGCIGPAVRIRCPFMSYMNAVCVVNSTVYIFEKNKSAYRLVLSSSEEVFLSPAAEGLVVDGAGNYQGVVVDGGLASSIAPMYHAKDFPVALPTPDGKKIILFSKRFFYKDSHEALELLNLDDGSWEALPPLPCHLCCTESVNPAEPCRRCRSIDELVEVGACSFTSNSHFLLQMSLGDQFSMSMDLKTFSLDLKTKVWSILRTSPVVPTRKEKTDRCYIETFKDRYALRPGLIPDWGDAGQFLKAAFQVYDHGNQGFYTKEATKRYFGQYMRRLSAFDPPWLGKEFVSILPLRPIKKEEEEEEEQVSNTCVLQLGGGSPTQTGVLIDVCRTELTSPGHKYPLKTTITKFVSLTTCHSLDNILGVTTFTL